MQLLDHMDIKQVHLFGASLGNLMEHSNFLFLFT